MKNEMAKCITVELDKREIQYDVKTNDKGLATISLDENAMADARNILLHVFQQESSKVSGSVMLRQKKTIH